MDDIIKMRRKFTTEEKRIVLEKTDGVCAHCGMGLTIHTVTVDHVFPLNKGGLNDEYNLLPLCEKCNNLKSNFVYEIDDFYPYMLASEYSNFSNYYNYVSYGYGKNDIISESESLVWFLPERYIPMVERAMKRNKAKGVQLGQSMMVALKLRKAYPGDSQDILNLIEKGINTPDCTLNGSFYKNIYRVDNAVMSGNVYTVVSPENKIVGAFIFEDIKKLNISLDIPQLSNVLEETGLSIKYIMTCATITRTFSGAWYKIIWQLLNSIIRKRWLPCGFGMLRDETSQHWITIPIELEGIKDEFEFLSLEGVKDMLNEAVQLAIDRASYQNEGIEEQFRKYWMRYVYLKDLQKDEGGKAFIEKYPELEKYFMPENFAYYGVGFSLHGVE